MNKSAQKYYDENKNIWGLSQNYKGIELYPIRIADTKYQQLFYELMTHPKNYIADRQVIKMSYLKFLMYVIAENADIKNIEEKITDFLKYITKNDDITFSGEGLEIINSYSDFSIKCKIGDVIFTERDLDNIREIILEQNGLSIEYVESYQSKLEEQLIYFNKANSDMTIEDEITIFCVLAGLKINEISDYTVYQFQKHFARLLLLEDYRLYKPLLISGQIEIKSGDGIKNYSSHIKKSRRYDGILIPAEEFFDKNKEVFSKTSNSSK